MGSFGVRVFAFNTNAFLADTKPTQVLSALATHLLQPCYKSGAMLDKITKACYNNVSFFWYFLKGLLPSHSYLKVVAQSAF
ncbi:hypothetical protein HMPREF1407_01291 [Helicobacter pylori GAM244Ai]|nr:hypothetical protein HMPREF1407_01291 [Helicobacter pylori GAM244Ai]